MMVFGLSAFAEETGKFLDRALMVAVISTKNQFVLDGVNTVPMILVAITVGCLLAQNGESIADGVNNHVVSLLLQVLVQLAETWICVLSECRRYPRNH